MITVVNFVAMIPVNATTEDDGATHGGLVYVGTTGTADARVDQLGEEGRRAAWLQEAIDFPFLIAYGMPIAGLGLALADRISAFGRQRLGNARKVSAWCGPTPATCDLIQNAALASVLAGHAEQPAPWLAAIFGHLTWAFAILGVLAIAAGISILVLHRLRRAQRTAKSG